MRMAANQLGVQVLRHIAQVEVSGFRRHLRVEEDLQQQVAELVLQLRPGATLDGVKDLVGLLQRVRLDGVEGLLAIPRTTAGSAQAGHDRRRLLQRRGGSSLSFEIHGRLGQTCFQTT